MTFSCCGRLSRTIPYRAAIFFHRHCLYLFRASAYMYHDVLMILYMICYDITSFLFFIISRASAPLLRFVAKLLLTLATFEINACSRNTIRIYSEKCDLNNQQRLRKAAAEKKDILPGILYIYATIKNNCVRKM